MARAWEHRPGSARQGRAWRGGHPRTLHGVPPGYRRAGPPSSVAHPRPGACARTRPAHGGRRLARRLQEHHVLAGGPALAFARAAPQTRTVCVVGGCRVPPRAPGGPGGPYRRAGLACNLARSRTRQLCYASATPRAVVNHCNHEYLAAALWCERHTVTASLHPPRTRQHSCPPKYLYSLAEFHGMANAHWFRHAQSVLLGL